MRTLDWQDLFRGLLEIVTYKIFKLSLHGFRDTLDLRGRTGLDPRGFIGRIYVGDHQPVLHSKYISCWPHGFREEDFKTGFFPFKSIETLIPRGRVSFGLQRLV